MERHFVTVGGGTRQVHYRRSGSGPALVVLHECPLSSRAYIPLAGVLSRSFTVIALDHPGFGSSDPLPQEHPEIEDFTDALVDTLDALGVERAALYGSHTGACVALDLAHRHPERVAGAVLDGLPRFDDEQRALFLERYTPRIEARWDGTHLLQAFDQRRDMKLFFPWFDRRAETRQAITMPPPEQLHEEALDLIKAKDHYWKGYQAAFRYRVEGPVAAVEPPVVVAARGDEILGAPAFPEASPSVRTEALPTERGAWAEALLALFRELPAGEVPPPAPAAEPVLTPAGAPPAMTRRYLRPPNLELLCRSWPGPAAGAAARPVVLLHPSPFSGALLVPLAQELARTRPVLLVDTPGLGDSTKLGAFDPEIGDYADAILAGLRGLGELDLVGILTGSAIAAEMSLRATALVRTLVLDSVPVFPKEVREELRRELLPEPPEPSEDGAQLRWAWGIARDYHLWFPHHRHDPAHMRPAGPPSPEHLHLCAVELLKGGRSYRLGARAAFGYDFEKRLPRITARTMVCGSPDAPSYAHVGDALALVPGAEHGRHDGTHAGRAALVAAFLDRAA